MSREQKNKASIAPPIGFFCSIPIEKPFVNHDSPNNNDTSRQTIYCKIHNYFETFETN